MTNDLSFDEQTHTYWWQETRELLSVTRVLTMAGILDTSHYGASDEPLLRGEYVHLGTELVDIDDLDWENVQEEHPDRVPYLKAYQAFKEACLPKWKATEARYADPHLGIAGTLDRFGTFVPPGRKTKCRAILDIKTSATGASQDWHPIQLAGYWHLLVKDLTHRAVLTPERALQIERWALYLAKDGSYRLQQFTDRRDIAVFNAAVTVAGWRHTHG